MKLKPFRELKPDEMPRFKGNNKPLSVYQSAQYLVQVFHEQGNVIRLTINSVKHRNGIWKDGLTFDELQAVKSAIGYGDKLAVEIYPEDSEMVNDANMRHLWILPDRPAFAWTRNNRTQQIGA